MYEAPPRRARRRAPPATREWPRPCPKGTCGSQGCVCNGTPQKAAKEYFAITSLLYGQDTPGMPALSSVHPTPFVRNAPRAKNKKRKREPPYRPPSPIELPPLATEDFLETSLVEASADGLIDLIQGEVANSLEELVTLFSHAVDSNNEVSEEMLLCTEPPLISKRVTWHGLPPNPPEWRFGARQAVPYSCRPCGAFRWTRRARDMFRFLPQAADNEVISIDVLEPL